MFDVRRVLEIPLVYSLFQKVVGGENSRRKFLQTHVIPLANGGRLLEIGCGPGNNLADLPENIQYVGCDLNERYIAYAQKKYGERGQFFASPVGKLADLSLGKFDVVMAVALLHHLSDAQIATLCKEVSELLKPGGSFITGDPCFTSEQSRIERYITSCDRGEYVRFPEQYKAIFAREFPQVRQHVNPANMLIPCMAVTMIAASSEGLALAA